MMRVLVAEDDRRIAADIIAALTECGFAPMQEGDGEAVWRLGQHEDFAAIILDLGLPGLDGLTVLKRWREKGRWTPVCILTARGGWMERVEGMDAGADDYLAKPFHMEELIARVRALVRRRALASSVLNWSDLTIDQSRMHVSRGGQPVSLTSQEFRILNYLIANSDRPIPASELIENLHGGGDAVSANAIEALIGRLRKKLGTESIRTRRGLGYVIAAGPT